MMHLLDKLIDVTPSSLDCMTYFEGQKTISFHSAIFIIVDFLNPSFAFSIRESRECSGEPRMPQLTLKVLNF